MGEKKRITTRFISAKIFATLLFIVSIFLLCGYDKIQLIDKLTRYAPFAITAVFIWVLALTRNIVYYDEANFYVHDWRGKLTLTVPYELITAVYPLPIHGSFLWTAYFVRYYNAPDNGKIFYILVNDSPSFHGLIERTAKKYPNLKDY